MASKTFAVIAAGGKGTRLSSISVDIPKPMVEVCGKPILLHQIECLKRNNIKNIFMLIGYHGDYIKEYFQDGKKFGVRIKYIEEKEPLGSAGALFYLRNILGDDFLFIFGDLIFDIDFRKMIAYHRSKNSTITLLTHPNSHPFDSDIIQTKDDLVIGIDSKNNVRNYYFNNLTNAGIYVVSNRIFNNYCLKPIKTDFEKDIVLKMIDAHEVYSYRSSEYVKDAGTPDRYFSVCSDVQNGIVSMRSLTRKQRCVFLDRDGTVNKYKGFIKNIDDIELEEQSSQGIKYLNQNGYLVIIITNQPVIARGDVTFSQLENFHNKISYLLAKEGAYFDDLLFCPHHPDSGFAGEVKELKVECDCRKPNIGLIKQAAAKYNIDIKKSFFVGDTTTDIQTGKNAKMRTILVRTGNKGLDGKFNVKPDFIVNNLGEIDKILKGNK